jgi:peroxiredoxin
MELLRDRSAEFEALGVRPLGISRDSPWTHIAWMQALDLNFGLLSDWNVEAYRGNHAAQDLSLIHIKICRRRG